jgi:beta-lactamase class A
VFAVATPEAGAARADAVRRLADLEKPLGGRIGVAALDTAHGASLLHRADERFALCSTFKWLLAAAVLAEIDRGSIGLDQPLTYGPADLLEVAPVTAAHVREGSLPVGALCAAAVTLSDNTAANLLMKRLGGPQAVTRFLRTTGDETTRLDRWEPGLNSNLPGDARDTTTPAAMLGSMRTILVGNALSPKSREHLLGWLKACETGHQRLRAGLPPGWMAGDKTGTGDRGAVNDIAIIWPPDPARPDRPPWLIAAYMSGSRAPVETLNAAHARIGGIVAAEFSAAT